MKRRLLCGACAALLLTAGCGGARLSASKDLTAPLRAQAVETAPDTCFPEDFGLRLFGKACGETQNTVLSPASVAAALSLAAAGADGETRAQMEAALGADTDTLAHAAKSLGDRLNKDGVRLANAVWVDDDPGLTVEPAFLQTARDWYGARVYQADLQTQAAVDDVNAWVSDQTDGLIRQILRAPRETTRLYLVNTVLFDQKWADPYERGQLSEGLFTLADGTARQADFLYSTEQTYVENADFTGFLKPYKGGRYSFLGLLPREGLTLPQAAQALDGGAYRALLDTADREGPAVAVSMPKLRFEWGGELADMLKALGMEDAFTPAADFSRMGRDDTGGLLIGSVLHKAYVELDEQGTKAAAATVVSMDSGSAEPVNERSVTLDRPFLFAIVENETGYPLFLGAVADPTGE